MENYSGIKKKGILSLAATGMELEDIMLNEISRTQEDQYCVFLFICEGQMCSSHRSSQYSSGG